MAPPAALFDNPATCRSNISADLYWSLRGQKFVRNGRTKTMPVWAGNVLWGTWGITPWMNGDHYIFSKHLGSVTPGTRQNIAGTPHFAYYAWYNIGCQGLIHWGGGRGAMPPPPLHARARCPDSRLRSAHECTEVPSIVAWPPRFCGSAPGCSNLTLLTFSVDQAKEWSIVACHFIVQL